MAPCAACAERSPPVFPKAPPRCTLAPMRYCVCAAAAVVCLTVANFVGPVLAWLLLIATFGFVLDAATAWFERAGRTGGLNEYRQ